MSRHFTQSVHLLEKAQHSKGNSGEMREPHCSDVGNSAYICYAFFYTVLIFLWEAAFCRGFVRLRKICFSFSKLYISPMEQRGRKGHYQRPRAPSRLILTVVYELSTHADK